MNERMNNNNNNNNNNESFKNNPFLCAVRNLIILITDINEAFTVYTSLNICENAQELL
jgi:hypothetical protein